MNVGGYNEYLQRLQRRISQALSNPLPKSNRIAHHLHKPYMQVNTAELTGWLELRQRRWATCLLLTRLFGAHRQCHFCRRDQSARANQPPECATQTQSGTGMV
jgi:hypothetical protein